MYNINIKYNYEYLVFLFYSGHARSLRFLNGEHLEFCDDSYNEIYNDPQVWMTVMLTHHN